MKKIVLTFGLISGVFVSLMMMASIPFMDGSEKSMVIGYTTMVLSFLLVYFGIRSYRDNVARGSVSFGRAFSVGILITLISSACYVATWEVIYYKIKPDFMEVYAKRGVEKLKASGATEAQVQAKEKEMRRFQEMYKNPLINAAITFIEPFPVGLIMTLVSAGILRRRRREELSPSLA